MRQPAAAGAIALGPHSYGKSDVRLVKVTRHPDRHAIRDLRVDVALEGDFSPAYVQGDNRAMLATDTMRNTIYALAKEHPLDSVEAFGIALARHFLAAGPTVSRARVHLVEYPWERIMVSGQPHEHAFARGAGVRTATVAGTAESVRVEAGIDDLTILKTTNSGWEGFLRDQYTTLPETRDRILATVLTATWSYGARPDLDFNRLWHGIRERILESFTDHYSPSVQYTL
ncbi:MAG: urate oxidase, partial [Thermomicrobiaceae bacterium]|nr:urate oxidase [Thermomicrobiaceae bacterium]